MSPDAGAPDHSSEHTFAPVVRRLSDAEKRTTVVCTVYAPRAKPRQETGLVVHLYGSGGSHLPGQYNVGRPPYDKLRHLLAERGYWLVVPELGPRHWMNAAATAQLDVVIDAMVRDEQLDPSRVHLLGVSMGAGSSLVYAMRHPERIASVVAIFPMTDLGRWVEEQPAYRDFIHQAHGISKNNRLEALRKLSPLHHPEDFRTTPVFLLHGTDDKTVFPQHSRDFAAALKSRGHSVQYEEVAGESHRDEIAELFQLKIADFVTHH